MRKIILAGLMIGVLGLGACAHRVVVTQQGTTYNDYEASKYRKVERVGTKKPKTKKKKQNW